MNDYSRFLKSVDPMAVEDHRAFDFTIEEELAIRQFAESKNLSIQSIIGIGFGGVAFASGNDKVLKYTYDDIEVSASELILNKKCEYLANVYEVLNFRGVWIILLERLERLNDETISELRDISLSYDNNKSTEWNFDDMIGSASDKFYESLSNKKKSLYDDLVRINKECLGHGFELLDCKIDNLGFKNGHLAMFDIKYTGREL